MCTAFVVKYEYTAKQRHLPLHTDQSTLSLTIALNEGGEGIILEDSISGQYSGGGTYFEALNETIVSTTFTTVCM